MPKFLAEALGVGGGHAGARLNLCQVSPVEAALNSRTDSAHAQE